MPITMSDAIANCILAVLPAERAAEYRASLEANGSHGEGEWVFADNEALQRAHDLFYPNGRPQRPQAARRIALTSEVLKLADLRRPICEPCERFGGVAGMLGVHCLCRGKSRCSNVVTFSAKCPEAKW
jgi:hypothetical protein